MVDEVLVDMTAGSPVLLVRIRDHKGVWLSFKQVHSSILGKHNRQTLQGYLEKMGDSQREAQLVEKDFLCVKGAIKTRASKVTLVKLESVCQLVRKVTNNHALVESLASIPSDPAHRIEDGTLALMRTVQQQLPPDSTQAGELLTLLSGATLLQALIALHAYKPKHA